jgi:hypothetical protein
VRATRRCPRPRPLPTGRQNGSDRPRVWRRRRRSTIDAEHYLARGNAVAAQLQNLPVDTVVLATNGSTAAVERARTILDLALPATIATQTISEIQSNNSQQLDSYRQLSNVVILTTLPIAGCSLAVNVAGGLADRKRAFSLLRLAGVPLRVLQRVITLEAAAPLLITAIVSAGAGLLAAQLFLRAQLGETLQPPGGE